MRRLLMTALTTAALGLAVAASPASAAVVVVGPVEVGTPSCNAWSFTQNETECAGGYEGNLLSGSAVTDSNGLAAIAALGGSGGTALATITGLGGGNVLNFGQTLSGLTILGIHYGAAGAAPEATSFFLFDLTSPTSTITITGRTGANSLGTSNAFLFATGGGVPEPTTWAMMLLGFGGIGMAMRRSRRKDSRLLQIA